MMTTIALKLSNVCLSIKAWHINIFLQIAFLLCA
jgi:hypothetical protein